MNAAERLEAELGKLEESMIATRLENEKLRVEAIALRLALVDAAADLMAIREHEKAYDRGDAFSGMRASAALDAAIAVLTPSPLAGDPTKENA